VGEVAEDCVLRSCWSSEQTPKMAASRPQLAQILQKKSEKEQMLIRQQNQQLAEKQRIAQDVAQGRNPVASALVSQRVDYVQVNALVRTCSDHRSLGRWETDRPMMVMQVVMKILKHCREHLPQIVYGYLLGMAADNRLEVSGMWPGVSAAHTLVLVYRSPTVSRARHASLVKTRSLWRETGKTTVRVVYV
jgi:hypothetical protein